MSKVGQVSRRTHKLLFLSIIAAKLDFFEKGSFNVYVADIQRQIVLKFQIYHIISFEDIMVESCRLPASSLVSTSMHYQPPRFGAITYDVSYQR